MCKIRSVHFFPVKQPEKRENKHATIFQTEESLFSRHNHDGLYQGGVRLIQLNLEHQDNIVNVLE